MARVREHWSKAVFVKQVGKKNSDESRWFADAAKQSCSAGSVAGTDTVLHAASAGRTR